jgi:hypothetical protein
MSICTVCGHHVHPDDRFCGKCGHSVTAPDSTGVLDLEGAPEPDHGETAVLVVWRGPNEGASYALKGDLVDIGRAQESQIFLDDITVSRHHATLTRNAEGWTLADAGSLNGSYVNRTRISGATTLRSGDEVQIGKYRFTFYASNGVEQ